MKPKEKKPCFSTFQNLYFQIVVLTFSKHKMKKKTDSQVYSPYYTLSFDIYYAIVTMKPKKKSSLQLFNI